MVLPLVVVVRREKNGGNLRKIITMLAFCLMANYSYAGSDWEYEEILTQLSEMRVEISVKGDATLLSYDA